MRRPSPGSLAPLSLFLCAPVLMHDPKIVRQLVEFTLNSFILNGQAQDVELSELKYEIIWTLHEHVEFLENPEIDAGCNSLSHPHY